MFATLLLCHELRLTSMKPPAGHPTLFVRGEAIRPGPRITPPTETTVDGDAPSRRNWSPLSEYVVSDEADGVRDDKILFFTVDGGSGHSLQKKDLDGP